MKKIIKNIFLPLIIVFACSCEKWLDGALPKDKNLDDKQFSTETGIHSVLNGLYSRLASTDLYGGRLTITDIELLAHYYYYENLTDLAENSGYLPFRRMSEYAYSNDEVTGRLNNIWNTAYKTIFEINTFIKNMRESTAIPDDKKNILLGEAYGLRAFIHFDLYRFYSGLVLVDMGNDEVGYTYREIPYNNSAEVVPHELLAPDAFLPLLLQDIEVALVYLKDDPITTVGIRDLRPACDNCPYPVDIYTTSEIFDTFLRNYRMNYYAVRALKARFLMFIGEVQQASQEAQSILGEAFGSGKPFRWADHLKIEEARNRNYIFYEEVIFGITNPDMYSRWKNYTSGTAKGSIYAVHGDVLRRNIFANDIQSEGDIRRWEDVRSRQWMPSLLDDAQYYSIKYERFEYTKNNPKEYFQPLIRTGELWYIIAEAALLAGDRDKAVDILDNFYVMRGAQANRVRENVDSFDRAYSFIETEYYKEFYGEGQAWFFKKRQASMFLKTQIMSARRGGEKSNLSSGNFFPYLPQRESDFE